MTMQGPPEFNYFGYLGEITDQDTQARCATEAAEEHQRIFAIELETMEKAAGLAAPSRADEIAILVARSPAQWTAMAQKRPDLYKKDFARFEQLVHQAFIRNAAKGIGAALNAPLTAG